MKNGEKNRKVPIGMWLRHAREEHFALAAFNAVNMETAQAAVRAAELEQAPLILQFSHNAVRYASLSMLAAIGRQLRAEASVPVFLHLDHAEGVDIALAAIDAGFDSLMIEAAGLPYEENVETTRRIVEAAHAAGVAVEAELEIVSKAGRSAASEALPADAVTDFVSRTACDAIVVDLGSHHKESGRETTLDLERLARIASQTDAPLVLHGASGVRPEDLTAAIALGISKINVATSLAVAFTEAVSLALADPGRQDPRAYLGSGRTAMTTAGRARLAEIGASGRAVRGAPRTLADVHDTPPR